MIEQALRKQLEPIVKRRRNLRMVRDLAISWFVLGLAGAVLIIADSYSGLNMALSAGIICVTAILIAILISYKCQKLQPDYRAIAHNIEQKHPELKALLLTAIEQKPQNPNGQLGYLQERVIGEAILHAHGHDWLVSVPKKGVVLANVSAIIGLLFLSAVVIQMAGSALPSFKGGKTTVVKKGYQISVTPGDTSVELGTPVIVLARFDGRLPTEAILITNNVEGQENRIPLKKNLDDPVFGGIIPQIDSDMIYRIEYDDKVTKDYKISTFEHPVLQQADAAIVYPSYTKLPEKFVKDTRQISAVEGSQITLTFTLNKPVESARLISKDQPALNLSVDEEHPNIYTTVITAEKSLRYELHLADSEGHTNKVPPRFSIDVHKNIPADLKPTFPNRDIAVSPLEEMNLEAEVTDDFGVVSYGITYTVAGLESKEVALAGSEALTGKQQIKHMLALEELGVQPDQLLTYYFWADDMGPDGKSRRSYSDMFFAEVRPFEEIFRESQSFQNESEQEQREQQSGEQSQQQRAEELVKLQKQIISATWNIKQKTDRVGDDDKNKEDIEVVGQSQSDAIDQAQSALSEAEEPAAIRALQEASKHMITSLEHLQKAAEALSGEELVSALGAEQAAYQELLKLREREHNVTQARNASRSNSARSERSQQQLQQLELTEREDRYETERPAQAQQQQGQREELEVLNRLSDLARRQNEMSDRLREAEAALREAQNEQQRQEALRELKRLRDQQLEALRDVDELQQQMERPQNRSRMADAREQLSESRSQIRQSAEELERGMVSRAATSATRAQRQLEQMRDEFQRSTSGQFNEQMRDMRERAQQLDQRQREIAEEISQQVDSRQKSLTDRGVNDELAEQIEQQRNSIQELIDRMKEVSEQAEESEPLLSRRLYDTLRETSTENVDRALEVTSELVRRNFLPQAQDIERRASEGIEQLRQGVEEAAEDILGNEADALRLARQELDDLIRQVRDEVAQASGGGIGSRGDSNEPGNEEPNEPMVARAQGGGGERQQGQRPENQEQQQSQMSANASQGQESPRETTAGQEQQGQTQNGNRQARDGRTARTETTSPNNPTGGGGGRTDLERLDDGRIRGPLTGQDFREWADRLRNVEDMVTESDIRRELARVRDRAQAIRAEFKRHGTEPQWDLVQQQITKPLTELYKSLSSKLARLESDEAMAPIDRDPVPSRFAELVQEYFERLGDGQ